MNILKFEFFDFLCWQERDLSVAKREICLLPRERSVCWQERDLSVGKRKICLLARERSVSWQERDLSVGKKEIYLLARERSVCWQDREREGPSRPRACEMRTQPKIILWVAVRTANSANFSLIKESKPLPHLERERERERENENENENENGNGNERERERVSLENEWMFPITLPN